MNQDERIRLIDELLDGAISEADFLRLEAELDVNPGARRDYYERLKLDTALKLEIEGREAAESPKVLSFPARRARFGVMLAAAAAVVVLMAGIVGWQMGRQGEGSAVAKAEPVASGFGVLAEHSQASWEDGQGLGRGDLLPKDKLKLQSGVAQLDLFSGVSVIVEGEAEFEILSTMEMAVEKGKVRAVVPEPARGFRIRTASGEVVDLGTEFALDVTPDGAEVYVLDGEIEYHPQSQPMRLMRGGESVRWTAGSLENLPSQPERFTGLEDLSESREAKRRTWLEHSRELREDPRLLAYFPMNQGGGGNRQLIDESGQERHGAIVRAQRASDRWEQPGGGLDFSPTGSRVRLNIPGQHGSLTFSCWVRIDSLDRLYNSLFLTDGHELGEPHWQIMDDGRLFFSVKKFEKAKGRPDKHAFYSPPIWNPGMSGQWMMIDTVYDLENAEVTHYIDGEAISREPIPSDYRVETVKIRAVSIGDWSEPAYRKTPEFAVRNLNGAIDEFAIFGAALSEAEIAWMYEAGRP